MDAAYQSMVVPVAAVAEIVTDPEPHRVVFTGEAGNAGCGFTVAVTVSLVADVQVVAAFLA